MGKWKKRVIVSTLCMRVFLFFGSVKSNGVILEDIVEQLETTNSLVGWAFALQNGIAYMVSPVILMLVPDYFSNWQLCVVGGILSGLGYIYLSVLLNSVWQLFISFTISGIGFGLTIVPSFLALQENCEYDEIPAIISFCVLFEYVGVAILPPVLQYFRSEYGLRNSLLLLGAIVWNNLACGVAARNPWKQKISLRETKQLTERQNEENSHDHSSSSSSLENTIQWLILLFRHNNFTLLLIFENMSQFIFVSWAIFLVSLGRTLGLSDEEAVLLSTAGGIGGFTGKFVLLLLCRLNKIKALNTVLIPNLVTGLTFVIVVFVRNFYVIAVLIFVSGLSQGITSAATMAVVPTIVCKDHYPQAMTLEYFFGGVAMQFAGLVSGIVEDSFGSTIFVYLFNALICFAQLPLMMWWACDDEPDLMCRTGDPKKNSV